MGTDEEKAEKKRLKAEYKLEKKRLKAEEASVRSKNHLEEGKAAAKTPEAAGLAQPMAVQSIAPGQETGQPWYKNPDWVRAIAAIASLIVAVIAIILTFSR